jgi:isopentenyldiphosphate isomerase
LDEDVVSAGERRLREEMGLDVRLHAAGIFTYMAEDRASGLIEHELDHVLVGVAGSKPRTDPLEADSVEWLDFGLLLKDADDLERYVPVAWRSASGDTKSRRCRRRCRLDLGERGPAGWVLYASVR